MIGVGVEGPSDRAFWTQYLHRAFPGERFDVRNMKTREKLIAATARLLATFRDAHYAAGMIVLDRDKDPCVAELRNLFDHEVRVELGRPLPERFLFLCVAVRKLESWFLADREAVIAVVPEASYDAPEDTSIWGVGKLRELWKQQYGVNSALNKIAFAEQVAPHFSAKRAKQHSKSLEISWTRICHAVQRCASAE